MWRITHPRTGAPNEWTCNSRFGARSGMSCIKRTRIPVHDSAARLANGNLAEAISEAYPQRSETQIESAAYFARAYPRRGLPRREPSLDDALRTR